MSGLPAAQKKPQQLQQQKDQLLDKYVTTSYQANQYWGPATESTAPDKESSSIFATNELTQG